MKKGIFWVILISAMAVAITYESRTSYFQSKFFSDYAEKLTYELGSGPSDSIKFPNFGPYNERNGYTRLPGISERLQKNGFNIQSQARFSQPLMEYVGYGGNPVYKERLQTGLSIVDDADVPYYYHRQPERIYQHFADIPPLLVNSLLFIENRDLLDTNSPLRNPAVEWDRLAEAVVDHGVSLLRPEQDAAGASTLATQLEKYRYSPGGVTTGIREKFRQMLSASLRAYQDGPDTGDARRAIIRDYINTTPLSGRRGFGEIQGVGEGLWAWYGIDFYSANLILGAPSAETNLEEKARVYKSALSLLLSQRRPSYYLLGGREELARLTDSHLRVLAAAGVIDNRLRDAALAQPLIFRTGTPDRPPPEFANLKAVNSVRTELLNLLDVDSLYDLDRMDLSVKTTVASDVQKNVSHILQQLSDPQFARSMGLIGHRLLEEDQLDDVRFSVVLYESTPDGNKLRVQTDNLDMPFDLNDDSKLDLGSTAKLRTLITYLSVIETVYKEYQGNGGEPSIAAGDAPSDPLRQWTLRYLRDNPGVSLPQLLDAAMQRQYSASPSEWFFTAGGLHRFHNFERRDNSRVMTVAEAFNRSVNLVFIRMMRDITRYYINEIPGITDLLDNSKNPLRRQYLQRFADEEGKDYLARFYNLYRGHQGGQLLDILARRTKPVPYRLAMAFRSVRPEANMEAMAAFMTRRLGAEVPESGELEQLYDKYGRDQFNSNDRAYLAGVHPLELWLVSYLLDNPGAKFDELASASSEERQVAYSWLFKTRSWSKQQKRIRILVEEDAFKYIHDQWQEMGYPFPTLVPSYATALGVSADRPIALTRLMGILVNDGLKLPMQEIENLDFAQGTPYETRFKAVPQVGEKVLSDEICQTVRKALMGIVESGTARRLKDVYKDSDGNLLAVGGKTGTGDHRSKHFGSHGQLLSEKVVNRNAIFTFFIDDRFFGTILASVGGSKAAKFDFTSGLATQLLKSLQPALQPLLDSGKEGGDVSNMKLIVQRVN